MPRSPLNALLTERALSLLAVRRNSVILDLVAEDAIEHNISLRNVCAKVHPHLADRIDEVTALLNISKRRFLEAAFIEACNQADAILEAEGVNEFLRDLAGEQSPERRGAIRLEAVEAEGDELNAREEIRK